VSHLDWWMPVRSSCLEIWTTGGLAAQGLRDSDVG
jgi:hypothetical protein